MFVQEYTLPLPTGGPRKQRKQLHKLSTFTHTSQMTRESKRREQELTNIAKNAMSILQAHGITAQTSPYALAIADIHKHLRSSPKSQFLTSLSNKVTSTSCPILVSPPRDLSVIVDLLYFLHMLPHHQSPHSVTTLIYYGNKP